ncbi:bifunctional pyr operon transcriptional regulator/uracil phosphoribosyltransferase PyrR [Candidatus Sumerlaeota bacterium]|nr:bifunctional pyr operon transcriptional regulator/uracil phosphoribosyltransferase PyrR [Candidatus Sumerlaeota bacterium]
MSESRLLLDAEGIEKTIRRIVEELASFVGKPDGVVVIGIRSHGVTLAERIHKMFALEYEWDLPLGILDTTMYRDDLAQLERQPPIRSTQLDFDVTDRLVVLVDDVISTGRTARCALDAIMDFGRPRAIRLVALVDRGLRELPIQPNITGIAVDTTHEQRVQVCLRESDSEDGVWLHPTPDSPSR